jgi:hypothetical protein
MELKEVGLKMLTSAMIVGGVVLFKFVWRAHSANFRKRAVRRHPGIDEKMGFFFVLLPWLSEMVFTAGMLYLLFVCWFTDVMVKG